MKLCWVTIRVSDVARSLHFYHDILGLPIALRHLGPKQEMVMLGEASDPKVELLCFEGTGVAPGEGISFGLMVNSAQQTLEILRHNGIPIESSPISPNPGLTFFFVKDPDGYGIQFVEQK